MSRFSSEIFIKKRKGKIRREQMRKVPRKEKGFDVFSFYS
jgi:hypothetical protein